MPSNDKLQFGMIGLGRMGANMVRRLMKNGHPCVVYDRSEGAVSALVKDGATGSSSLAEFVNPGMLDTREDFEERFARPIVERPRGEVAARLVARFS